MRLFRQSLVFSYLLSEKNKCTDWFRGSFKCSTSISLDCLRNFLVILQPVQSMIVSTSSLSNIPHQLISSGLTLLTGIPVIADTTSAVSSICNWTPLLISESSSHSNLFYSNFQTKQTPYHAICSFSALVDFDRFFCSLMINCFSILNMGRYFRCTTAASSKERL